MNFYEILKTKKLGRGSPDYWTQLFAEHVGGKGEWKVTELTGMLPITFRSNGTALINYRIYGTAEGAGVQTENLINVAGFTMTANAVGTSATKNIWEGTLNAGTYTIAVYQENVLTSNERNTLRANLISESIFESPTSNYHLSEGWHTLSFTIDTTQSVGLYFWAQRLSNDCEYSKIMLVKDSTQPSTYIPYGNKIPLTLTSGAESKDTDIYIGDSKLGEAEYVDYGEQKIYRRILFMTHDDKHFITKDNKDFCLRRRGYSG